MILRQGIGLVIVGLLAGLVGAYVITQLITSLLFSVQPFDVGIYAAVAGLFATVGAAACLVPAQRASKIDPIVALRSD